jgi:hypothetical protein
MDPLLSKWASAHPTGSELHCAGRYRRLCIPPGLVNNPTCRSWLHQRASSLLYGQCCNLVY